MSYSIEAGVTTNQGNFREQNEDNFLCGGLSHKQSFGSKSLRKKGKIPEIYAVCDGMGGLSYGYEAAYTVVRVLSRYGKKLSQVPQEKKEAELDQLIKEANLKVCEVTKPGSKMGSTLALVYLDPDKIYLANVGDSPIYQIQGHNIHKLSFDHNQAQFLKSLGLEYNKDKKHALTQYLGMPPEKMILIPHYESLEYQDMMLLLCSDGLTEALSEEEIAAIVYKNKRKSTKKITNILIKQSMKQGSEDNLTALLIKIRKRPCLQLFKPSLK